MNQRFPEPSDKKKIENPNERFLIQPIYQIKHLSRIQWDISSPTFANAQLNLGLVDSELILKSQASFL